MDYLDYELALLIKERLDESDRSMDGLYEFFGNNQRDKEKKYYSKGILKLIYHKFWKFEVKKLDDLLIMNVRVDHTPCIISGQNRAELKEKFKRLLISY